MMALEERLLSGATDKPWLWWRFIDDIFLIWRHGEEKLKKFLDSLNQAHESIKFTAEWSKERVSFLDVQVIKEGNRIITDLFKSRQTLTNCCTVLPITLVILRRELLTAKL